MTDPRIGRSLAWRLDIAGLATRYYGGQAPPTTVAHGAVFFRDVDAVLDVSAITAALDEVGGVIRHDPVTVRLAARDVRTSSGMLDHPVRTLRRIGADGATYATGLYATIEHAVASPDIYVTSDVTGWPSPGVLHIGQEAFRYTGTAGAGLGSWRFTGTARPLMGSQYDRHTVSARTGRQPSVVSEVVYWRGRRAWLYVAPVLARALTGADYVEHWTGIIDTEPTLAGDGMTITISIAPLTSILSRPIDAAVDPGELVQAWHYFDGDSGHVVQRLDRWPADTALNNAGVLAGAANPITMLGADMYADVFDWTLPAAHPRGWQPASRAGVSVEVIGIVGPQQINVTALPSPAFRIYQPELEERSGLSLIDNLDPTTYLAPWPGRWWECSGPGASWQIAADSITSWATDTTQGWGGRWHSVGLVYDNGWVLTARRNSTLHGVYLVGWDDHDSELRRSVLDLQPQRFTSGDWTMWAGLSLDARDTAARPEVNGVFGPSMAYNVSAGADDPDDRYEVEGLRQAWYQGGERYFLATTDLYSGASGGLQWVKATATMRGEQRTVSLPVIGSVAQLDPLGNIIGYRHEVRRDLVNVSHTVWQEWGGPAVTLEPSVRVYADDPIKMLLMLLISGRGGLVNSATYDTLPVGLNIPGYDVDIPSFRAVGAANALSSRVIDIPRGATVLSIFEPILKSIGYAIGVTYRAASLRHYVSLVRLGVPSVADAVASITDADCTRDGMVASRIDGRVIRAYRIEANFAGDGTDAKPQVLVTYVDSDAVGESGGDAGETLTLPLRGVTFRGSPSDIQLELLGSIVQPLRARLGRPRLRYDLTVWSDQVLGVTIGSTVLLTSTRAALQDGTEGVTDLPCRVVEIRADIQRAVTRLGLMAMPLRGGARSGGYVPAMRVSGVTSPTVVVVESNAYTATVHPVTGAAQLDPFLFLAGDDVSCVPVGNWSGRVTTSLVSVVGTTITTTAPHGLAIGDTIRHDDYAAATVAVQAYAYLSSDADELGAGDPPRAVG